MGDGFRPFRRDVSWREAMEVPIHPLLGRLSFSRANKNWGYQLRFGVFEIPQADLHLIADAMGVKLPDAGRDVDTGSRQALNH